MLEWYRTRAPLETLMDDCAALVALAAHVAGAKTFAFRGRLASPFEPPERLTVREAFLRHSGIDLYDSLPMGSAPDAALLEFIHTNKTGKLLRAACRLGALAAGAQAGQLAALTSYAEKIGLAFQIADDVLNVTGTPQQLGKAVGSDAAREKMTYVALYGLEIARAKAAALVVEAQAALAPLGARAAPLAALADFIVARNS